MKVLFDYQTFSLQQYGGISRYFQKIIVNMSMSRTPVLLFSNNEYIKNESVFKYFTFFKDKNFKGKKSLLLVINKLHAIINLRFESYDLFHPTYYDPYFLSHLKGKPYVLTIHDMTHELYPSFIPKSDKTKIYKRLLAERASAIIAISNNTKEDIIKLYDVDPNKIHVIYHGNSFVNNKFNDVDFDFDFKNENYLLFVGSRSGYKNFNQFVEAVSTVLKQRSDLNVVCIGGNQFDSNEKQLFKKLGLTDRFRQYAVCDSILSKFYSNAELFVFPSLYEGFGIPILEAFTCKCPLVCSNTSSFPEIAGHGAVYFDPDSVESMRNSITEVLENDDLRSSIVDEGCLIALKFSWEMATTKTEAVYKSVIDGDQNAK